MSGGMAPGVRLDLDSLLAATGQRVAYVIPGTVGFQGNAAGGMLTWECQAPAPEAALLAIGVRGSDWEEQAWEVTYEVLSVMALGALHQSPDLVRYRSVRVVFDGRQWVARWSGVCAIRPDAIEAAVR